MWDISKLKKKKIIKQYSTVQYKYRDRVQARAELPPPPAKTAKPASAPARRDPSAEPPRYNKMFSGKVSEDEGCTGYLAFFISGIRSDIRFHSPDIWLKKLFKIKYSFDKVNYINILRYL